jgi:hypothetical protein
MDQSRSKLVANIGLTGARLLAAVTWLSTIMGSGRKYRPEAHYMRGPGPKWWAKNTQPLSGL